MGVCSVPTPCSWMVVGGRTLSMDEGGRAWRWVGHSLTSMVGAGYRLQEEYTGL